MEFASPLPWWLGLIVAAAIGAVAYASYRRPLVALTQQQRAFLIGLRGLALGAVVVFLCRPIALRPPVATPDIVVPILVDASRSMRVVDAAGQARLARAIEIVRRDLLPGLSARFTTELYAVGERLVPAAVDRLDAQGRRSDLTGALTAVRDRYRGRRIAGVILLTDGGDTGQQSGVEGHDSGGPPVFAVGVGSTSGVMDREVVGLTAGDPRVDQATVDLQVSAVSRGFGRAPFELRLLADGRPIDSRRVVPAADGSPSEERFTVSPDPLHPMVYTAQIAAAGEEPIVENNERSVLVRPPGRKRRVLAIEGAPGFEHSFIARALTSDPSLELDTVVRKGKNDAAQDTFLVQAAAGRTASLVSGFPSTVEALYAYDAVIVANVEADYFTRAQLQLIADFVSERGGGLLVTGARAFAQRGLIGTPLEEVLPVELNDRRGETARTAGGADPRAPHNVVVLTPAGESHPVMRLGDKPDENRKRWAALPPLAAISPLGAARPGASVLAVGTSPGGDMHPVVAVQRYGRGRSMIFGGEASWRWRMLMPATDKSFEFFWRQAIRWLAVSAPDPVSVTASQMAGSDDALEIDVDVRDATFAPAADATVEASVTDPSGARAPLPLRHDVSVSGRSTAAFRPERPGLYRVQAEARRGNKTLGAADHWLLVGGDDREFADPRLNEAFLRRIARASGGRYVQASEAAQLVSWLQTAVPQQLEPERHDLWHEPWAFGMVIALLSAEWVFRRRWGLR